ncbi:Zn(II)2Cys6 transcription factor [Aspergillus fijiensis CBS 313.89]|uniref:Zn(2)-C6 fungal-type domain-containing protein n=1 Tax=Aspergillus fijiensis CBS 313.89 TaxID=1448319 RepID=A0A8G1VZJ4_9EURO|nr:uncharacterized protein BO72DRAFT_403391 [Aspergillus fijiensis CBS 313.89]RAK77583.1 hypothetical protein BO72DRAFT_403391 [Aspergillus fijiensis CBS 313.89]
MRSQEITPLKACRPCSKAKTRCDPGPTSQACQRCHRLRKECTKQAPGAHSLGKPRTRTLTDVRRLERKLENMTSLLGATQQPIEGIISNCGCLTPVGQMPQMPQPQTHSSSGSDETPQATIAVFHQRMATRFPFVVCASPLSDDELLLRKPFLHMVMSMIACRDQEAQWDIAGKVKAYLVERVVVNGEASLDLFQGFLLFLAWAHIHVPSPEQLCNYLHLLVAQSKNLGLARDVSSGAPQSVLSYMKCRQFERPSGPGRTLEERKASLGCFYLVTMISMCLGESEPMQYTSYLEESYQVLQAAAQGESDRYLLCLVDLARMAEKIHRTLQPDHPHDSISSSGCSHRGIAIRWLQKELEQLKPALAFDDPTQSSFLLLQYHNLELFVYRTALRRDPDFRESTYPPTHLTTLHACLHAVKSFFNTFFAIPSSAFFHMPYLLWCQLGHGFLVLSHISVYDDGDDDGDDDDDSPAQSLWDREYARQVIDYQATVDRLTQKVADAVTVAREEGTLVPRVFGKVTSRIAMWRDAHARQEEALRQRQRQRSQVPSASTVTTSTTTTSPEVVVVGMETETETEELVPGMGLEDLLMIGPMWEFLPF